MLSPDTNPTAPTDDFQVAVRQWLEANCPESMRTPMVPEEYPGGGRRAGVGAVELGRAEDVVEGDRDVEEALLGVADERDVEDHADASGK